MYRNYPFTFVLIMMSVIFIFVTVQFLPLIPTEICIAGTYSAAGINFRKHRESENHPVQSSVPVVAVSEIKEPSYAESALPVAIQNDSGLTVDINNLMSGYTPPERKTEPQILIVHTHATESYIECDNRSLDSSKNMVAVGTALKESLEGYGFSVVHDPTYHDYPNYNGSYANCLKTIESCIEKYPGINIVLDLHRDGIETEDGKKLAVKTEIDNVSYAQLMFVVGTDASGLYHPAWQDNLKFAAGLQKTLCGFSENLMRPINLRYERFNQHLTKNSLIIEVGSNGNSLDEAIRSVKLLAKAMSLYIK